MREYKKLWFLLAVVFVASMSLLAWTGVEVYRQAPPIPAQIITENGKLISTEERILDGQTAWQSTGGMQLGSIWGHGAYQAPDWSADWLHRELVTWLNLGAQEEYDLNYDQLSTIQQAGLRQHLKDEYRKAHTDEQGVVIISERRAQAIEQVANYYIDLYGDAPELRSTRESYAMKENTLPSLERREDMTHFFFWLSWASVVDRPDSVVSYTNNWPHEPLVDNKPSTANIVWSVVSVVLLLAGIAFLVWGWAFLHKEDDPVVVPKKDPILSFPLTPSQLALKKYLFLTVALFLFQVFLGGFTAHYTVEGQTFYGIDISQWFPYSLTRTWHIQTALFWIASGFLAAGLFLVPIINGGKDPKYQRLGVNILFGALVVLFVGSFTGNYLAIKHIIPEHLSFWFGHQGYEYVDLGRFWQIIKLVGLVFWLILMLRGMVPALKKDGDKNLLALFCASTVAIGIFYGAGLFYGERTAITIMEYWRWWVVHLWVEGFFEVFATASLAFIFASLGLISKRGATAASLVAATLFLLGGVPGTLHHLYFSGTTTPIMAVGATFSALEVVPLIIMGYEAYQNWRLQSNAPWMKSLRWPIMCFVAVSFWNMLGAGVFGFMINPPIALYYIQGLNTTPVHAHAALFGVYGFLSLGFVLLVTRYLVPNIEYNERLMAWGFWGLNIGLVLMIAISLMPIGVMQAWASVSEGMWYARSEEFMQQPIMQSLRWWRTLGDVVFIAGAALIFQQVVRHLYGKGFNQPATLHSGTAPLA